jgi:hypothetical protein
MYTETYKKFNGKKNVQCTTHNCVIPFYKLIGRFKSEHFRYYDRMFLVNTLLGHSAYELRGGDYEDSYLLECNTVQFGREIPAFQRNLLRYLPRQLRYNPIQLIVILYGEATLGNFHPENRGRRSLRILVPSVKLHGLTSHKIVVFIHKSFTMDFIPTGRSTHFRACSLHESIWNDQCSCHC